MSDFVEKLKLKGMAEEDIYFARRDRELLEALHRKELDKQAECPGQGKKNKQAKEYEKRFEQVTDKHRKHPRKLARAYRTLLAEIRKVCRCRG